MPVKGSIGAGAFDIYMPEAGRAYGATQLIELGFLKIAAKFLAYLKSQKGFMSAIETAIFRTMLQKILLFCACRTISGCINNSG